MAGYGKLKQQEGSNCPAIFVRTHAQHKAHTIREGMRKMAFQLEWGYIASLLTTGCQGIKLSCGHPVPIRLELGRNHSSEQMNTLSTAETAGSAWWLQRLRSPYYCICGAQKVGDPTWHNSYKQIHLRLPVLKKRPATPR